MSSPKLSKALTALCPLSGIEPRRCQPHKHLASLWRRGRYLFELHHLGTTTCMDAHGFYNIALTSLVLQDMYSRSRALVARRVPIVSCFSPGGQAAQQKCIMKMWACGVLIVGMSVGAVPKH